MNTALVKAASVYQVKTGLVTVAADAVSCRKYSGAERGTPAPATSRSAVAEGGFTVNATTLALAAVFAHIICSSDSYIIGS